MDLMITFRLSFSMGDLTTGSGREDGDKFGVRKRLGLRTFESHRGKGRFMCSVRRRLPTQ
eukprot:1777229-Amphidinium_carterae.1